MEMFSYSFYHFRVEDVHAVYEGQFADHTHFKLFYILSSVLHGATKRSLRWHGVGMEANSLSLTGIVCLFKGLPPNHFHGRSITYRLACIFNELLFERVLTVRAALRREASTSPHSLVKSDDTDINVWNVTFMWFSCKAILWQI